MKEVFISYKTEEFDEANWVKSTLETNGISCWMAPMCIPGGSNYAKEIPKAIKECKVFVLILSEKSQESKWVPRELNQAINEEKIIMPFALENCALKDDFNFYLTNVQRYQAYESKVAAMEKMIREIRACLGKKDEIEDKTQEDAQPETEKREEPKAEPKEKPEKIKKTKKAPKVKKTKKQMNIRSMKTLKIAATLMIVIICGLVLKSVFSKTTIAGKKIEKDTVSIYLQDCEISMEDWNKISKLANLNSVNLKNCVLPTENLGMVCDSDLKRLCMENCGLTDAHIASLHFEEMNELTVVDLSENPQITDLSELSSRAKDMYSIDISGTSVIDLEFLRGSEKLVTLYADGLGISNLLPLSECEELNEISVNDNSLKDFKGLEKCIRLKKINACNNELTSLEGLNNTSVLTEVMLDHNLLEEIFILAESEKTLEKLSINYNCVDSLEVVSNAENLKQLYADENQLISIKEIEKLVNLEKLSVSGNQLETIEGVGNCTALIYMNFSNNQIMDVEEFLSMTMGNKYQVLDLSYNKITDLYIPMTEEYKLLNLYGNKIENMDILSGIKIQKCVFDYSDNIDFEKLLENEGTNYYILNCPLNRQLGLEKSFGYRVKFIEKADADKIIEDYLPIS